MCDIPWVIGGTSRLSCCRSLRVAYLHVECVLVTLSDMRFTLLFSCSPCSVGAVDGCQTPCLTPSGDHKEYYTDKKSNCSMLMLAITDTRRVRLFAGGFPGSRGDSMAFHGRSWYKALSHRNAQCRPLSPGEFVLGDAGFAHTVFVVSLKPHVLVERVGFRQVYLTCCLFSTWELNPFVVLVLSFLALWVSTASHTCGSLSLR